MVLLSWLMDRSPDVWQVAEYCVTVVSLAPILWFVFRYSEIARDQRKTKHYQAWQAIADAHDLRGNLGRKEALEDLHEDGISLTGVEITGRADLEGICLPKVRMDAANLSQANLTNADLHSAHLNGANLQAAALMGANFRGAQLEGANLASVLLDGNKGITDFTDANMRDAKMFNLTATQTVLTNADLTGAVLSNETSHFINCSFVGATLTGAKLFRTVLTGSDFEGAVLNDADLGQTDLSRVKNLTEAQVCKAANLRGATMPSHLKHLELPK